MPDASALTRAESLITSIPDYPKPGIMFRDITPLLTDAAALRTVVEALVEPFEGRFDAVAGVEARGFKKVFAQVLLQIESLFQES